MKITKLLFIFNFLAFSACSYLPENTEYMKNVHFEETTEYIKLLPVEEETSAVLLFLPGGLVDPHAYISSMNKVVEKGVGVVIMKFSANLAMLESSKPLKIMDAMPEVDNWYIGGHSLGGIVAQMTVNKEPDLFQGLVFLGVYPAENYSISNWDKHVLSLYASNDGLSTVEEVEASKHLLPEAFQITMPSEIDTIQSETALTLFYLIEGGNHSQFGDYGFQKGDGAATISMEEQHEQISECISKFITWNENN